VDIILRSGGKRTVGKHRSRWDQDTKNNVKNLGYTGVSGLNLSGLECALVQVCFEDVI